MEDKIIENDIVKINYPKSEQKCIPDVLNIIQESYQKGLAYFGISSLTHKIEIKIYSSIEQLHQEEFGSMKEEWLVCCGEEISKVVSPLHPGKVHSYTTMLKIIAGIVYSAIIEQYTNGRKSIFEIGMMVYLAGLERNTTTNSNPQLSQFKEKEYFNFSDTYYIVVFILLTFGKEKMLKILKHPTDYLKILQLTEEELDRQLANFYQVGYRERIRVAGLIPMKEGFIFIHRTKVEDNPLHDYYVFSGGGLEDETLEEGTKREIKEELGITVEVKELLYTTQNESMKEYIFLCEYIEGELGTGEGPEFNGDPKYIHKGNYIPVVISKEELPQIQLVPFEIKEQLIKDMKKGRFDK